MKALVIVHAENDFVNPRQVGKDRAPRIRRAFDNIAQEIPDYLEHSCPVYFFAQEARAADSQVVYEGIRPYAADITFFPAESTAGREYLRAKERLMADSIDEIVLGGVSRIQCVAEVFDLLSGRNNSRHGVQLWAYEKGGRELGWDDAKFLHIYRARLSVHIDEELTAV